MGTQKKTEGQASLLLERYEQLNSDLPKSTRRQLAIFVLAHRVGRDALEALFDRSLGQTPFRHRAWMWYTALSTSGLKQYWPKFAHAHNSGEGIRAALDWLKEQATDDQWKTLSRRLFQTSCPLRPSDWDYRDGTPPDTIWTAGGTWNRRNNMAKIIVLGEHIERDYTYNTLTEALGEDGARQLERELYNAINPDKRLVPNAKFYAVDYVRRRLPRIAGWSIDGASLETVSWFFQEPVYEPGNPHQYDWRYPIAQRRFIRDGRVRRWEWLP